MQAKANILNPLQVTQPAINMQQVQQLFYYQNSCLRAFPKHRFPSQNPVLNVYVPVNVNMDVNVDVRRRRGRIFCNVQGKGRFIKIVRSISPRIANRTGPSSMNPCVL